MFYVKHSVKQFCFSVGNMGLSGFAGLHELFRQSAKKLVNSCNPAKYC